MVRSQALLINICMAQSPPPSPIQLGLLYTIQSYFSYGTICDRLLWEDKSLTYFLEIMTKAPDFDKLYSSRKPKPRIWLFHLAATSSQFKYRPYVFMYMQSTIVDIHILYVPWYTTTIFLKDVHLSLYLSDCNFLLVVVYEFLL